MEITRILNQLDRIKKALEKDNIFKTTMSADQRIQVCIFEMMAARRSIDHREVRRWSKHNYQTEPNPKRCEEVCKLWIKEIDAHNRSLFKNQKKLF